MNDPSPPLYPIVKETHETLKALVARVTRMESRLARLMVYHGVPVDSRAQERQQKQIDT